MGRVKNFAVPDYDAQNRRRAVLFGEEAISGTNGLWNIHKLRIESYAGQTNPAWVVEAPACLYHDPTRRAWSDGPLTAASSEGQLSVTGRGFDWRQSEQRLVISNEVRTILRPAKSPQPGLTNMPGLARHDLELTANVLEFDGQRSAAHYRGEVHVRELLPQGATNPPVGLDCEELTIFLSTNRGGVDVIEARGRVIFTQGTTQLEGEQARYSATNNVIVVEGGSKWTTDSLTGQAERLRFDRNRGEVLAEGSALARLHEASDSQKPAKQTSTNALELAAPAVMVVLPSSNRPMTTLMATGKVALSRGDLRAGGESLSFTGTSTSGVARIEGAPWWRTSNAEGKAGELYWDRGTNVFSGRGGGQVTLRRAVTAQASPESLVIQSDEYDLADDQAVFRGHVKTEDPQWRMEGGTLRLIQNARTREVHSIVWEGGVVAEQRSRPEAPEIPWRLQCTGLTVEMTPDGQRASRLVATGKIQLEPAQGPKPGVTNRAVWKLQCERLTLNLNLQQALENVVAEKSIYLETGSADGRAPVWALTGERLELDMVQGRTNQVERIRVERQVTLRQAAGANHRGGLWHLAAQRADIRFNPTTGEPSEAQADGGVHAVQLHSNLTQVAWTLTADSARLWLGPSNRVDRLQARRSVRVEQGFTTNPPPWQMQCEQVDLTFSATNTLQTLDARQNVVITQGASRATGEAGFYNAATENFELRGQPTLLLVEEKGVRTNQTPRRLEIEGAEVLVWNRAERTFRGRGQFRIRPEGAMNMPRKP